MKVFKGSNRLGLIAIAVAFGVAAWHVVGRQRSAAEDGRHVIRVAHWQLETGPRQALDAVIADYEAMHPDVKVEQIAVPPRGYPAWLRVQLVGGTAPDLVQVGPLVPGLTEIYARYLTPLTPWVKEPNPYNAGTPLADVPWRDTIIDGMSATMVFSPELQEYYAVPTSLFTVRVFYNAERWRQLLGDRPVPTTYAEFAALCREIASRTGSGGRPELPIAGASSSGLNLLNRLFASQTQRLDRRLAPGELFSTPAHDLGLDYLAGRWSYREKGPREGVALMREAGGFMQPGFTEVDPSDELFQFLQGRALMILTGSYNITSVRANADFGIGVFELPIPGPDHPLYGAGVVGPASEATIGAEFPFGITRASRQPARALDFLRFMASQPGNTRFAAVSGWLPAVVGVPVSPALAPFAPRVKGVDSGFDLRLRALGPETTRVVLQSVHRLLGPAGGEDAFIDHLERVLPAAIRRDLELQVEQRRRGAAGQDAVIAAHRRRAAGDPEAARKAAEMGENQLDLEATGWWIERGLRETATSR